MSYGSELPFYAETSHFQSVTAFLFMSGSAFFFSLKKTKIEFLVAGLILFYVAFDEKYMIHECFKIALPDSRGFLGSTDLIVLCLGGAGIFGSIWGVFKLAMSKFEKILFIFSGIICTLVVYLDTYGGEIFYLKMDIMIEEISELVMAILLIVLACCRGIRLRVFIFLITFSWVLFLSDRPIKSTLWEYCPKVRTIR